MLDARKEAPWTATHSFTSSPASPAGHYIGVTSDLAARIWRHRHAKGSRFTTRYKVFRLVYVEAFSDMDSAIAREKRLKRWHRPWKINLIERDNPHWIDLAVDLGFEPLRPQTPAPRPRLPGC
jgi:putative endonuclease